MEAQAVRSPALTSTTPFTPASPLPSMDVLMQDPGMLYSSPGQEASAPNEETPPVKKALPREVTLEKLERAETVISQIRKGAEDLIAALRETAVMKGAPGSTADGRKRGLESGEEGTSVKRARIGNAETAEKDDEGSPNDDQITPVSRVISRVEAALAELAGLGKELTEAGVSFSVNGHEAEPNADFAKREWDTLVARRKAEDDLENAQAALRKLHLQLRRRYEEDRETVWEIDRVMKGLDAREPDRVSKVLQRLRESGLFAEEKNAGPQAGLSIKEQLERVHESVTAMELKLLGENGKDIWSRSESESKSSGLIELAGDDQGVGDRPASLSCLLPGVLKATIGVSREGQLMTVSISAATQVRRCLCQVSWFIWACEKSG
jgi:hypothetical protein